MGDCYLGKLYFKGQSEILVIQTIYTWVKLIFLHRSDHPLIQGSSIPSMTMSNFQHIVYQRHLTENCTLPKLFIGESPDYTWAHTHLSYLG